MTSLMNTPSVPGDAHSIHTAAATAHATRHKGLAALLLAAIVAALVTAADSVVDSYADGHLLLGWISLWAVGFAALALFADSARKAAARLVCLFAAWTKRRAQRRSDAQWMALAAKDPRIMADLQAATARAEPAAGSGRPAAGLVGAMARSAGSWSARRQRAQADAALWATAQRDPRVMAEVQAAMERAKANQQMLDQAMGRAWLSRHPVGTFSAAYQGPRQGFRTTPLAGLPTHLQYLPS